VPALICGGGLGRGMPAGRSTTNPVPHADLVAGTESRRRPVVSMLASRMKFMSQHGFRPRFSITNAITNALTRIERARGFLEAATLSE
jgi:hypothetical protein